MRFTSSYKVRQGVCGRKIFFWLVGNYYQSIGSGFVVLVGTSFGGYVTTGTPILMYTSWRRTDTRTS